MYGFWNDHHVALVQPAEDDLPHCPPVLFRNGFQCGIIPDVILAFSKRSPGFMLYALTLQEPVVSLTG